MTTAFASSGTNNPKFKILPYDASASLDAMRRLIPDADAAREYIEKRRWGESKTVACPRCHSSHISARKTRPGYYQCMDCHKEFTVRTGTPMERSHITLDKWIYAMYLIMMSRKSITALLLAKMLDITPSSAYMLLRRLRHGLNETQYILNGDVQVDEVYIGGVEKNRHKNKRKLLGRRGAAEKQPILGLYDGKKVVFQVLPDKKQDTIMDIIFNRVKPGSMIFTDEAPLYDDNIFKMNKYGHKAVNHHNGAFVNRVKVKKNDPNGNGYTFETRTITTNSIESVWAVLKRGIIGVHHHISWRWMQLYVNEYAFRLNEGASRIDLRTRIASFTDKLLKSPKITLDALSKMYPKPIRPVYAGGFDGGYYSGNSYKNYQDDDDVF